MHGGVWGNLAAMLASRYRVTSIDLPGHGRSTVPAYPYVLDQLADDLAASLPRPATWLGWSLGGLVAATLALRHPAQVDKLVLVATTPRFVQAPDWRHAMSAELLEEFARELTLDYRATLRRFLGLQVGLDEAGRQLLRTLRREMFRHGEPQAAALAAGLNILRDTDLRPVVSRLTLPALIIHGEHDRLAPPAAADYWQSHLPQARSVRIARAGHAPFWSHPVEFARALQEFL
jgi:pimeloyl-[acyl-carrier protein] methyl ester esterase